MKKFVMFIMFLFSSVFVYGDSTLDSKNVEKIINDDVKKMVDSINSSLSEKGGEFKYTPFECSGSGIIKCIMKEANYIDSEYGINDMVTFRNIVMNIDARDLKHVKYSVIAKDITYNFLDDVSRIAKDLNVSNTDEIKQMKEMKSFAMPKSLEYSGTMDYTRSNNAFFTNKISINTDKITIKGSYDGSMESVFLGSNFADALRLYHAQLSVLDTIDKIEDPKEQFMIIKDLMDMNLKDLTFSISGDIVGFIDMMDEVDKESQYGSGEENYGEYYDKTSTKEKWLANIAMAKSFVNMPKDAYPSELNDIKNSVAFNKILKIANNALNSAENVLNGSKNNITLHIKSIKEPIPYIFKTLIPWGEKIDSITGDAEGIPFIKDSLESFFKQYDVDVRN